MSIIQNVDNNETVITNISPINEKDESKSKAIDLDQISTSNLIELAKDIFNSAKNIGVTTANSVKDITVKAVTPIADAISESYNDEGNTNAFGRIISATESVFNISNRAASNLLSETLKSKISTLADYIDGSSDSTIGSTLAGILRVIQDNLSNYQDGVNETSFGIRQDASWYGSSASAFLNGFQEANKNVSAESRKINILNSTPLDSGSERDALYGSLMLGAPFLFNEYSDPTNRTLINSLIKDGRFITFTPGLPKFNGTSYTNSGILDQTKTPSAMLEYLTKNGLDQSFSDKDKRYYTFKTDYEDYFSYLETMLNTVWIKMGLAKNGSTFNLFSFFQIKDESISGGINPTQNTNLKSQYKSSIGFFVNPSGRVTETISNTMSNEGDDLASRANENARQYQRINYITGMGTGGSLKNLSRQVAVASTSVSQVGSLLGETFSSTISAAENLKELSGIKKVAGLANLVKSAALDVLNFNSTQDLGAIVQSFATSNGMQIRYPNLWTDSAYARSMSFDFTFSSPYGDPLSIFKYVYAPFFALLTFAMPRQAAENGFVSPFFVRCDIPGLITSDLALISDITWTKGGNNNLWTKDGLPREISVSITVSDLYPYLAMSKRISFLSANPSYAVFLDSMSGMLALNDNKNDDGLNNYFKEMINRVNGLENKGTQMWNKFNTTKSKAVKEISESVRASVSATVDPHAIPWLHNSSIR